MSIVTYNNRSIRNISAIPGAAESLTHIKTLTASSSSTLSFVNGSDDVVLDSTYPIYLFKFIGIHPSADGEDLQFNMSADSGSNYNVTKTTTAFRAFHNEAGNDTNLSYHTGEDLAQGTGFQSISYETDNANDSGISGTLNLFNPSSTTFVKHFIAQTSSCLDGGASYGIYNLNFFTAGYGNTTSAIDAVQFKMSSGNLDSGDICLYGIN